MDIDPDTDADASLSAAMDLFRQGLWDEAARTLVSLSPPIPEADHLLAAVRFKQARMDDAERAARSAVAARPAEGRYRFTLGEILAVLGRKPEAVAQFDLAARLSPAPADSLVRGGELLTELKRLSEAERAFAAALAADPDHVPALVGLAGLRIGERNAEHAADLLIHALTIAPDNPRAQVAWADLLTHDHRFAEAETFYRKAMDAAPRSVAPVSGLARLMFVEGRIDEAVPLYRQAVALRPDSAAQRGGLLFALLHDPTISAAAVMAEHRAFDAAFGAPVGLSTPPPIRVRAPGDRLRIGYLSPDFWAHPVASFFLPILRHHDRAKVAVHCYADIGEGDAVSRAIADLSDGWTVVGGFDDATLAEKIRADGIDVLIDLAGHAGGRMGVFARRPAPVQLSWLGYLGGTGLSAIDGRISDSLADPSDLFGPDDPIFRLPDERPFLAFDLPAALPEVTPPPCLSGAPPTFASFNKLGKVNAAVIDLWADLLTRRPDARLLLKSAELSEPSVRARIEAAFAARGVAPERLTLVGYVRDHRAHLAMYAEIDVALDPFPWNGGTTTVEALSMGRPVVSLAEPDRPFRMGASLLGHAGLGDLAVPTPQAYVEAALALIADPPRLETLALGLRDRLRASPLTDVPRFTRALEALCLCSR